MKGSSLKRTVLIHRSPSSNLRLHPPHDLHRLSPTHQLPPRKVLKHLNDNSRIAAGAEEVVEGGLEGEGAEGEEEEAEVGVGEFEGLCESQARTPSSSVNGEHITCGQEGKWKPQRTSLSPLTPPLFPTPSSNSSTNLSASPSLPLSSNASTCTTNVNGVRAKRPFRPWRRMRVVVGWPPVEERREWEEGAREATREEEREWRRGGVEGGLAAAAAAEEELEGRSGTSTSSSFAAPVALPSSSPSQDLTSARGWNAESEEGDEGDGEVGRVTTWTISCEWREWISRVLLERRAIEYCESTTAGRIHEDLVSHLRKTRAEKGKSVKTRNAPKLRKLLAHSNVPLHGSPTSLTKTPSVVAPV